MQFTSIAFLIFFAVTAMMFRACQPRWRTHFLLAISYVFYCTWSIAMAAFLLLVTVACYFAGLALERWRGTKWASRLIAAAIALLVIDLVFFKSEHFIFAGQS